MKHKRKMSLSLLIFMAFCCDMGIFLKKLIAPATNLITDALHIPGGIGTSFSLMFVLIGAALCDIPGSATLMSIVQSLLAVLIGSVGSMGMIAPIGYVVPGIVMDLILLLTKKLRWGLLEKMVFANVCAGVSAALCANIITFRLCGPALWLYISVACTSGVISGILGKEIIVRVEPIMFKEQKEREN